MTPPVARTVRRQIMLIGLASIARGRVFTWVAWPGGPWIQWGAPGSPWAP